jgi:hypothetical protein
MSTQPVAAMGRYSTGTWRFGKIRCSTSCLYPRHRTLSTIAATTTAKHAYLGEIPKYGTAQPTIFWNAGAATDPP